MTGSIKYENGELIIPYSSMVKYIDSLGVIYAALSIEGQYFPEAFYYNKKEDYIPFRLLDGEFIPHVDTFLGDSKEMECSSDGSSCAEYSSHYMKGMVGTIGIDKKVNVKAILANFHAHRKYDIVEFRGPNALAVQKATGKFAEKFWEAYNNGKDLILPMSQKVYELISVESTTAKNADLNSTNKQIVISSDVLSKVSDDLRNNKKETFGKTKDYINSSDFKVRYELHKEAKFCLNTIGKIILNKESHTEGKVFDIKLDEKSSIAIANYLSNPEKINYEIHNKIDGESSEQSGSYIDLRLPNEFISLLYSSLNISSRDFTINNSIEIVLKRGSFPQVDEYLNALTGATVDQLIGTDEVPGTASKEEAQQILESCNIYLDLLGESE